MPSNGWHMRVKLTIRFHQKPVSVLDEPANISDVQIFL
jgi:ATPase subunit of ABC transporter with duplicated ATPase domains